MMHTNLILMVSFSIKKRRKIYIFAIVEASLLRTELGKDCGLFLKFANCEPLSKIKDSSSVIFEH